MEVIRGEGGRASGRVRVYVASAWTVLAALVEVRQGSSPVHSFPLIFGTLSPSDTLRISESRSRSRLVSPRNAHGWHACILTTRSY